MFDFLNFQFSDAPYWVLFFLVAITSVCALAWLFISANLKHQLNLAFNKVYARPYIPFLLILFAAIGFRLWYCTTPAIHILDGDAGCRVETANDWPGSSNFFPGGLVWLPLHFFILMLPKMLLGMDIVTGSRLITLLISICTFPVFYLLVKKRFDKSVALISCFLLAINPFHIKYSVNAMSEIPFHFFVFSALLLFFLFIEKNKIIFLFLSALAVNSACLIRFEGWIFAVIITFFALYYTRNLRYFFLYGALNAVSILIYIPISYASTGYLVYGLSLSDQVVRINLPVKNYVEYLIWGFSIDVIWPIWMLLLLVPGIVVAALRKKEIPWLMLAGILLASISYKVIMRTNGPTMRYFSTGLFLMTPFIGFGLTKILKRKSLLVAVLFCLFFLFLVRDLKQYEGMVQKPNYTLMTIDWIKAHRQNHEKYLLSIRGQYDSFRLLTNTPTQDLYFQSDGTKNLNNYEAFTDTVFLRILRTPGYKYMIYETGLTADSIFHMAGVQQDLQVNGPKLDSIDGFGNITIYEIKAK